MISIHALREEGDDGGRGNAAASTNFYPRPPRGGRRSFFFASTASCRFLSTPSARRATARRAWRGPLHRGFLSTPSARRATGQFRAVYTKKAISIHALREEGDCRSSDVRRHFYGFLSTPSARRATRAAHIFLKPWRFLSTPSARRATAKTETKSLFSYKLYNILHEFRRALIYNGSKNYPNHAK